MRKDNRGMSLVELIISIAISAIIMLAAITFLSNALRSYNFASATISMQSQAQVLMEQIGKWTMEGNRLEVSTANGNSCLVIWQIPQTSDTYGAPDAGTASNRVIWMNTDGRGIGTLYTKTYDGVSVDRVDDWSLPSLSGYETEDYTIGEYVTGFTVNELGDNGDEVSVCISFEKNNGTQTYELSNDFKVRNMIVMNRDDFLVFA